MARLTPEQRQRAGEAVQMRRAELGLTQVELTERAHVTGDRVGVLERAQEWPQPRTRAAIEAALGWRPGALGEIARGAEPSEMVENGKPAADSGQARADVDAIWPMLGALMARVPESERADWVAQVSRELGGRLAQAEAELRGITASDRAAFLAERLAARPELGIDEAAARGDGHDVTGLAKDA